MDTKKTTQKRTGLEIFDSAASGLQQLKQRLETLGLEWSGTPSIEIVEMSGRAYVKTKLTLVMPVDPQLPVSGIAPTNPSDSALSKAASTS
jgi:hypothetical protein